MDTQTRQPESYLPLEPAASWLGLPKAYLRHLADRGQVPFILVGKSRRFCLADVRARLRELAEQQRLRQAHGTGTPCPPIPREGVTHE